MKKIFLLFVVSMMGACTNAQNSSDAYYKMVNGLLSHSVPEITVDSLKKMDSSVILLDARETNEFKVSSIKGAKYVGYDNFSMSSVNNIPKDVKIVVYCSVGYRSEKITEKLIKAGYHNVSNLYGGIFDWVNKGNTVYCNNTETQRIHAYNRVWGQWLKKGEKVY